MGRSGRNSRLADYWSWLAAALFLLITLDLLTTVYAAAVVGIHAEQNRLIRWTLSEGPAVMVAVNLLAAILVVLLFDRVLDRLERTPAPYDRYFALVIEGWLGLLVVAGLVVFANNLAVIVLGESLL